MPSSALLPWVGLPGPHPGFLSFHDESHQRRVRGCPPELPWGALSSPQQRKRCSPQKVAPLYTAKTPSRIPQSLYLRSQYR